MKDEYLRRRLWRKLESLPDERLYQVVDYLEFLEAKYGEPGSDPDRVQRFAEDVQDRMRRSPAAGRWAFKGMLGALGVVDRAVGSAARAVRGLNHEIADLRRRGETNGPAAQEGSGRDRTTRIVVE